MIEQTIILKTTYSASKVKMETMVNTTKLSILMKSWLWPANNRISWGFQHLLKRSQEMLDDKLKSTDIITISTHKN